MFVLFMIVLMMILFVSGIIRYEFISLSVLLVFGITGVISAEDLFSGFSHPAVITVLSVLVISHAMIQSGLVEHFVMLLNKKTKSVFTKILALMLVTGFLSAFMNNVGALALVLPVALSMAKDMEINPSQILMPVAFSSLLGGMVTLIGTPPNLIVSNYRFEATGEAFDFFSFAPVGLTVFLAGTTFMMLFGKYLIPKRKAESQEGLFDIGHYLSEVEVVESSKMVGESIFSFYSVFKIEVEVLSIIRDERHIIVPSAQYNLRVGDVLIIKTDSTKLTELIQKTGLKLRGAKLDFVASTPFLKSDDFALVEVVIRDDSILIGRTAFELSLRNRYNINLVAVSRQGAMSIERLKSFRFKSGDILLLQAPIQKLQDTYQRLSCLPLEKRKVVFDPTQSKFTQMLPLGMFLIAIILTTLGLLPVQISFSAVAILLVLTKTISVRVFYEAIEWPTILLLGSLLPLGTALQNSGVSGKLASLLFSLSNHVSQEMLIVLLMVFTIVITNLISSTATAVLMGPVAVSLAAFMNVSPDPLLVSVAIASTTAFITPIAHQSNMLVMGPGGYQFRDYWKLGLALSILSIAISVPLIVRIWPL